MVTALIIIGFIVLLIAIVALYIFSTQRKLVNLDELSNNAISQISVQLSTRWDAVTALVKMTEKAAKHEHDTLVETIAQRRAAAATAKDINQQQGALSEILNRLMVLTENYPEIKALPLYSSTMQAIQGYEENVRHSRMVYNDTVTKINRMIRQWPSSFVASMLHFNLRDYLEKEEEKKDFPTIE
ncbi:MAG: LemA family protein [Muribaculaceae bacterium]|nr:LemA family protein [Muribaculaceae bacterium]MBR5435281.1 LemA family protein [Muribaculaceae bacterium]MBR5743701.1 LemA family protein [Muribaculaceae bacterium]